LSSLLLGLQTVGAGAAKAGPETAQVQFSVDHHFARNSRLRFMTFIYNAARSKDGKSLPNVWIQARILHGGQVVKTIPMQRVTMEPQDIARIPFQGEVPLSELPAGLFTLEITVTDEIAKLSASQQARITVQ